MNARNMAMAQRPSSDTFFPPGRAPLPPLPGPSRPHWKTRTPQQGRNARRKHHRKPQPYEPPRLRDLQLQNQLKASRFFHPRRFKHPCTAPCAPFNNTSYIMRSKDAGGIGSLVSPCPVTPAVLPTPVLSPSLPYREVLSYEVNKEWGVNGYGSMNGLIRLRPDVDRDEDDDDSESDVDQIPHAQSVQQLEQRLDHDISRFEMIYPAASQISDPNLLATHMDDQDSHIAHLEEENLILKERLYLMQQELDDLRRRMQRLESGVSDEQAEVSSERSVGDASVACDANF